MNEATTNAAPYGIEFTDFGGDPVSYTLADHFGGAAAAAMRQHYDPAAVRVMLVGIAALAGWR